MPLFRRKTKYDYRTDFLPQAGAFRHLERIAHLDKVVVREPKMDESTVVFLPYPKFHEPDYKSRGLVHPDFEDPTDSRSINPEQWLYAVEGVRYFGKNPVSLLFDNPEDSGFIPNEHHPVNMIYEAAIRTVKSKGVVNTPFGSNVSDEWDVLLNGSEQSKVYACISRPASMSVAYVLAYQLGKDNYLATNGAPAGGAPNDKPVVFLMTQTTTRSFLEALDGYMANEKLTPADRHVTGHLAVHFFDRKKGVCSAKAAEAASASFDFAGQRGRPAVSAPAAGQLAGYGVHLTRTLSGRADDQKIPRDKLAFLACNTLLPWEKVLRGHTPAECAQVVASHCSLPLSLLYFAWKSMPEYYTDEIKTALRNPSSANFRGRPQDGQDPPRDSRFGEYGPAPGGDAPPTSPPAASGGAFDWMNAGGPPGDEPIDATSADPGYDVEAQRATEEMFRQRMSGQNPRPAS